MPYYKKKHILFIHIPKTGGTSVEDTLKHGDIQTMYSGKRNNIMPIQYLRHISLQHQTFNNIFRYRRFLPVKFDSKLRVISVVRNPYTRIVSDLFFHKLINVRTSANQVNRILRRYVRAMGSRFDNHNLPQYKFITDVKGKLIKGLILIKQENLNSDMKNKLNINIIFNKKKNGEKRKRDYYSYLNNDSIRLINRVYKRDFELFGYKMIQPKEKTVIKNNQVAGNKQKKKKLNTRKIIIRRRNKLIKIIRNIMRNKILFNKIRKKM